jgi:hypothetical protein
MKSSDINELEENISSFEKNKIKILLACTWGDRNAGLGDKFGSIGVALRWCKKYKLLPSQIYWQSPQCYEDLTQHVTFEHINCVKFSKTIDETQFTHILTRHVPSGANENWGTPYHLKHFIKFNSHIIDQALPYKRNIGVHFRFKEQEQLKPTDNRLTYYKEKFAKIYDAKEQYFVCSDSPLINEMFSNLDNVITIKKTELTSITLAKQSSLSAILDLAVLSMCPIVYQSHSHFVRLSIALSQIEHTCENYSIDMSGRLFALEHIK